ncbi:MULTISPECIES: branched-chain amino acid ABC transporter permease [unclassified Nocardioides]|uniref:branched-chain amino acid ABC transporter permease n=1 Tax=unclassified Nocardioides TaxID=2615069 RepID=UPI0006FEB749|nr:MULTISPECIES: branched-chain amino acid ABC transporter permease [unclassified Nocardioides]KQY63484.1 hypothetical protein ASD30_00210 [Nocardioides sp. Root140]KRF17564.1 hypothetical protein ASH02_25220 [Nocardioides sp. Soil796]
MRTAYYKVSYLKDAALYDSKFSRFWMIVLGVAVLAVPLVVSPFQIYLVNQALIAAIAAIGLNLLIGNTGLVSLGHAAFMAIGAYTTALVSVHWSFPFLLAVLTGAGAAALFGTVAALPALRLKGLYLALVTMGFAFVVDFVIRRSDLLGRDNGLLVPIPSIGPLIITTSEQWYFLLVIVLALIAMGVKNLIRRGTGRAFAAIRDRDIAAAIMGVNLTHYKILAFALSSAIAGLAGGFYASLIGFINPAHFNLLLSVEFIAMIIIGGLGSVLGSIVGALFLTFLPELIRGTLEGRFTFLDENFEDFRIALFGFIIVVVLVREPDGFVGRWRDTKNYFRAWPYRQVPD